MITGNITSKGLGGACVRRRGRLCHGTMASPSLEWALCDRHCRMLPTGQTTSESPWSSALMIWSAALSVSSFGWMILRYYQRCLQFCRQLSFTEVKWSMSEQYLMKTDVGLRVGLKFLKHYTSKLSWNSVCFLKFCENVETVLKLWTQSQSTWCVDICLQDTPKCSPLLLVGLTHKWLKLMF